MLRATRPLFAAAIKPLKATTGITGLEPVADPLPVLRSAYQTTLNLLENLPSTSVYRQATEALMKHKLAVVEKAGGDVKAAEAELGMAELAIEEAKTEQGLIGKMIEWKPWEKLEQEAPKDQWRYFDPAEE
ncbi:ETC complex I subunit conserved region-domain-containing protein [Papiliotrema laurentii]|uniref:ETC complex I subunit conserved region-domain-containing protein n=1 Tax=Papiliotrema laurentii TaxID=5418 RepID=A0AAD9FT09_PAPLA|nr:ETC complex I subunit conserved region-domain-containing protein [Papiliotrema laurentii]